MRFCKIFFCVFPKIGLKCSNYGYVKRLWQSFRGTPGIHKWYIISKTLRSPTVLIKYGIILCADIKYILYNL